MPKKPKTRLESAEQGPVTPEVSNDAAEPSVSPQSVHSVLGDSPLGDESTPPRPVPVAISTPSPDPATSGPIVQTISLAETKPVTAQQWADRKLRAEVAQRELISKYRMNRFPLEAANISFNSMQMLMYALIMEGRITQDEMQARLGEYQLLYMEADFKNQMNEKSQRKKSKPIELLNPSGEVWKPKHNGKLH